ncbi:MAG: 4-(cytidine 5'-diphospho)-2-C-methyl-D-erythritol kinase, partial [Lachnospiraceae bacterium]|nr:4-(cytidine 5'-diphospho)-2-C-methyl-D-erythritol kinase [Lachnospiraceae bacterium]
VAAGLAGGSSDAAAVLVGVNRLFRLGLTSRELMERGVKLGADIPYCIMRGTALAEGIGEKLTPLMPPPRCQILIAKPKIHVSTKFVYGNLKANELKEHPDIDGQIAALAEGDLRGMAERMGNVLETVTIPAYPVIEEIKNEMKEMGALNAMMSGSGPTVFGLFEDKAKARKAYERLKKGSIAKQVYLTDFFYNSGGRSNGRNGAKPNDNGRNGAKPNNNGRNGVKPNDKGGIKNDR